MSCIFLVTALTFPHMNVSDSSAEAHADTGRELEEWFVTMLHLSILKNHVYGVGVWLSSKDAAIPYQRPWDQVLAPLGIPTS